MFQGPPSWVYPNARFDIDFANGRYWSGAIAGQSTSPTSCIQSLVMGPTNSVSASYAPDINNKLIPFTSGIPRITAGRGLWSEGPYTNYALWCRDLTNIVWAATTATVAKDQVGADGVANAASSILATGITDTVLQVITQASTTFVGSAYIKRLVGSGTVQLTIDGSTYTDVTSLINSNTYTLVMTPVQTLANPTFGFKLGTNGDKIAVDFCQCENSPYKATTPLMTTSASVGRGTEEPTFSDAAGAASTKKGDGLRLIRTIICTGGPYSILLIGSGNGRAAGSGGITSDANMAAKGFCGAGGSGAVASFTTSGNTTVSTANTGNTDLYNINKTMIRANGTKASVCLNGGAVANSSTNATTAQSSAMTHIGLGNIGAGTTSMNGVIARIACWDREVTDGEMMEFTR